MAQSNPVSCWGSFLLYSFCLGSCCFTCASWALASSPTFIAGMWPKSSTCGIKKNLVILLLAQKDYSFSSPLFPPYPLYKRTSVGGGNGDLQKLNVLLTLYKLLQTQGLFDAWRTSLLDGKVPWTTTCFSFVLSYLVIKQGLQSTAELGLLGYCWNSHLEGCSHQEGWSMVYPSPSLALLLLLGVSPDRGPRCPFIFRSD